MKFVKDGLVFVEKKRVEREGKKTLEFVTVADPETYESETFILNTDYSFPSDLKNGELVNAEVFIENRFTSMSLKRA